MRLGAIPLRVYIPYTAYKVVEYGFTLSLEPDVCRLQGDLIEQMRTKVGEREIILLLSLYTPLDVRERDKALSFDKTPLVSKP